MLESDETLNDNFYRNERYSDELKRRGVSKNLFDANRMVTSQNVAILLVFSIQEQNFARVVQIRSEDASLPVVPIVTLSSH